MSFALTIQRAQLGPENMYVKVFNIPRGIIGIQMGAVVFAIKSTMS